VAGGGRATNIAFKCIDRPFLWTVNVIPCLSPTDLYQVGRAGLAPQIHLASLFKCIFTIVTFTVFCGCCCVSRANTLFVVA
jgi:hypothetical protein